MCLWLKLNYRQSNRKLKTDRCSTGLTQDSKLGGAVSGGVGVPRRALVRPVVLGVIQVGEGQHVVGHNHSTLVLSRDGGIVEFLQDVNTHVRQMMWYRGLPARPSSKAALNCSSLYSTANVTIICTNQGWVLAKTASVATTFRRTTPFLSQ